MWVTVNKYIVRPKISKKMYVEAACRMVKSLTIPKLGTPTILVNNAAIVTGKSMSELTPSEIDRYESLPQ